MNYKHQVAGIVFTAVIHSISMCRMRRFLAILRSFFHPSSHHLAFHFLIYLSVMLFPNSYTIPLWEFHFLQFSVHAVTIHNSQHKLHQSSPVLIHIAALPDPTPHPAVYLYTPFPRYPTHTHTCARTAVSLRHTYLGSSTSPSLTYPIVGRVAQTV